MFHDPGMKQMDDRHFGNVLAQVCVNHFAKTLTKRGKPQAAKEWTLMAAIAMTTKQKESPKVVAMGTGSKCLGANQLSDRGEVLHDSHAEVIARRAFTRFIFKEASKAFHGVSDVLTAPVDGRCSLKEGVQFHMFTSHTPCGDASIIPKCTTPQGSPKITTQGITDTTHCSITEGRKRILETDDVGECVNAKKLKGNDHQPSLLLEADHTGTLPAGDIHRTGAKCVEGASQDTHDRGAGYHTVGVLRTKPGRGDRTQSLSCSDKMARWSVVGIQGALLSHFLSAPIYLETIVVGSCPYSPVAMKRAVVGRLSTPLPDLPRGYHLHRPSLIQADLNFEFSRSEVEGQAGSGVKVVPSSAAIIWYEGGERQEVAVHGRALGVTAKNKDKPQARVSVCPFNIFQEFCKLHKSIDEKLLPETLREPALCSYLDYKLAATDYQAAWSLVKSKVFPEWPSNPHTLYQFKYSDSS